MHSPQQSPPSKLHSALFVSSLQLPFPINLPFVQSLEIKKEIFQIDELVTTIICVVKKASHDSCLSLCLWNEALYFQQKENDLVAKEILWVVNIRDIYPFD